MVLIVRFAVAPRKQADDFGACVVDAPQGGDAGFDLGLHVLDRAEVAALEDGCAELVGFEEIPESFEESLRVGLRIFAARSRSAVTRACATAATFLPRMDIYWPENTRTQELRTFL